MITKEPILGTPVPYDQFPLEEKDYSTMEIMGAAVRQENSIGSALGYGKYSVNNQTIDRSFNPFNHIEGYEESADAFVECNSIEDVELIKTKLGKEAQDREILSNSGWGGTVASLASGILDPINLIPVGGQLFRAAKLGKVAAGAINVGLTAGASTALEEVALQETQDLRTMKESVYGITGATLLGGVLGGVVGTLSRKGFDELSVKVDDEINDVSDPFGETVTKWNENKESTVGAAQTRKLTMDDFKLISAFGVEKLKINPILRTAQSDSVKVRQTSFELFDNPLMTNYHEQGGSLGTNVVTEAKMDEAKYIGAVRQLDTDYKEYLNWHKQNPNVQRLTVKEYEDAVGMAMHFGDDSGNPIINKTASTFRNEVFDPLKNRAIELGMLPEDVKVENADSYFTTQYNRDKIIGQNDDWRYLVRQFFSRYIDNEAEKLDKSSKEYRDLVDTKDVYLDEIVNSITNRIQGIEVSKLSDFRIPIIDRGPLKERTLNIPIGFSVERNGRLIKFTDFINTNVRDVSARYTRIMSADTNLKKKFGDVDLKGRKEEIINEYNDLISKAKTEKERLKLSKRMKSDLNDIDAGVSLIRGTYGMPANSVEATLSSISYYARMYNYVTSLGSVALSSIPDIANIVMLNGFKRTFGTSLKYLIGGTKNVKALRKELRISGQILEDTAKSRMLTMAEMADPYATGSSFSRFAENTANAFSKFTLMDQWNSFGRTLAGGITQERLIDDIIKFNKGTLGSKERTLLASVGFSDETLKSCFNQLSKHSSKDRNITLPNTKLWDNEFDQDIFRSALSRLIDRQVVVKNPGDVPLFMEHWLGKLIMQFKSFALATHMKVLLPGLQRMDTAFISGITSSISLGMLVYYLKTVYSGRKVSDNPAQWIMEGIDRGGVAALLMEVNNTAEKLNFPGLTRLTGAAPASRYASRGKSDILVGPTASKVAGLATLGKTISTGEMTDADKRSIRKLIPFQNSFGVSQVLDALQGEKQ